MVNLGTCNTTLKVRGWPSRRRARRSSDRAEGPHLSPRCQGGGAGALTARCLPAAVQVLVRGGSSVGPPPRACALALDASPAPPAPLCKCWSAGQRTRA